MTKLTSRSLRVGVTVAAAAAGIGLAPVPAAAQVATVPVLPGRTDGTISLILLGAKGRGAYDDFGGWNPQRRTNGGRAAWCGLVDEIRRLNLSNTGMPSLIQAARSPSMNSPSLSVLGNPQRSPENGAATAVADARYLPRGQRGSRRPSHQPGPENVITPTVRTSISHAETVQISTLNGPTMPVAHVPYDTQVKITDSTADVGYGAFTYAFPAHSITRIHLSSVRGLGGAGLGPPLSARQHQLDRQLDDYLRRASAMQKVPLEYGDGHIDVDLPDSAIVIRAGEAHPEPPPLPNPEEATRAAVREPLGCAPLGDQVGPGSTVTIAFPDRVKGGAQETSHRKVTLRVLLDELERAGVRLADITLVCAIGLHRKNFRHEFESYLGVDNLARLRPEQVVNHDSEDPDNIVSLNDSSLGDVVQMNRRLVESDLTILIGHTAGNPYGGFSGGYKMPSTGLTTWRSIRGHHAPASLYRDDFLPVSTDSHFRHQLASIGKRMESAMPRPFFAVDAVLDRHSRQLGVYAGAIGAVENASWPLARERTQVTLPGRPADVLLLGLPRSFHYGPGMGSNPVLMMQAIGSSIARAKDALVPNPIVIAAAVCDGWFNEDEFPSYRAAYEALQTVHHPSDMVQHEEAICTNYEWIHHYRFKHAYHPFHAFSMLYVGGLTRTVAGAVYIAGARDPGYARGMGGIPTATVEDALAEARGRVGAEPKILVIPELSKPAYHVRAAQR
jgi:hypothetical protein